MKILIFSEKQLEPFIVYHDPKNVCCINDKVIVGKSQLPSQSSSSSRQEYDLLYKDVFWTESSGITEVCVVLYVEKEESQR